MTETCRILSWPAMPWSASPSQAVSTLSSIGNPPDLLFSHVSAVEEPPGKDEETAPSNVDVTDSILYEYVKAELDDLVEYAIKAGLEIVS